MSKLKYCKINKKINKIMYYIFIQDLSGLATQLVWQIFSKIRSGYYLTRIIVLH